VGDWPAPVLHGSVPPEGDGLVVEVHDAGLTRLAGRLCTQDNVSTRIERMR
jgi:hypothetical protein